MKAVAVMADNIYVRVAIVQLRFEDSYALSCKLGTFQPSYQFFGLAREHGATYNLNPPMMAVFACYTFYYHNANL